MVISYNGVNLNSTDELFASDIQGLGSFNAINKSEISGYDGSTYVSEQMNTRNITLTLLLSNADEKALVYSTFKIKEVGVFKYGEKQINCRVETIDIPTYSKPIYAYISLICTNPYFTDETVNSKIMSAIQPLFRFPFTFNGSFKFSERMASVIENFVNDSSIEVSPIIEFKALTNLTNPSIMNINTYEKAKVNVSMSAGDKVVIDTRRGYKTVTLTSNGVDTDIFNYIADDFRFIKLSVGDNYLKYDADSGSTGLQVTLKWDNQYGGV